jgi:uncharacterized protein (TIGR03067 family)
MQSVYVCHLTGAARNYFAFRSDGGRVDSVRITILSASSGGEIAMRLFPLALGLSLLAGFLSAAPAPKEEIKDKDKLQGTWEIVSIDYEGQHYGAESYRGWRYILTGDKMVRKLNDDTNRESVFVLDPSKKPKTIDLTYEEPPGSKHTALGVYELDGDTLKWCFGDDPSTRPTGFDTSLGSGAKTSILQRVKNP